MRKDEGLSHLFIVKLNRQNKFIIYFESIFPATIYTQSIYLPDGVYGWGIIFFLFIFQRLIQTINRCITIIRNGRLSGVSYLTIYSRRIDKRLRKF